ncbi:hypothetical protein C4D60_Mb01t22920 [Musa balbisiana]|uniref:Pentacotripeptide-repeat region of PRORP domain-containing protein n=1 Tax=Musa balbisiana TaxID=52838 RepID=A0A4S8JP56_MUSBA|nr:hypothetical protein C4D60_Mb01t22920 [Musa balbisiana]
MGLSANSITYCTVIDGYCKAGLFDEYRRDSLFASASTHNCIIRGLCRQNMSEIATAVFEDHVERNLSPDLITCRMLIQAIFGKVMSKSYNILLKSLLRTGDKQISELVICEFIKIYGTFEPQMTNAMFLYLSKKNVEKAIHFLNKMEFLWMHLFSLVVDGLCKSGYLKRALDLCGSMKRKGIYPNVVIYNSVINGLCQQGCLTEAFRIFYSLENLFYASYNCALSREGFLDDASQLSKRMIIKDWLKKLWISSQIWKRILNPDDYTIAAILNGFCQRGDIEGALGFFTETKMRGYFSDFLGFMNLRSPSSESSAAKWH